jgi:hypothetical protein
VSFGDKIIGKQILGMPGSEVLAVQATADYLVNGPVGDGWYVPEENRYVTTDFLVTVRLGDGREVQLPKSYQWLTRSEASEGKCTA